MKVLDLDDAYELFSEHIDETCTVKIKSETFNASEVWKEMSPASYGLAFDMWVVEQDFKIEGYEDE